MDKIPLVYSHNFLGEVEHGTHGYGIVCLQREIGMPEQKIDCKPDITEDIILDNDYDDTDNESEDNKSFLKTLKDSIKY